MSKYNLKHLKKGDTMYSRQDVLTQLRPSLALFYTLRSIFSIRSQSGRITNMDESMTYKFVPASKTWTI